MVTRAFPRTRERMRGGFIRRLNFRFSPSGRYAACLTADDDHAMSPELWDLTGPTPSPSMIGSQYDESTASVPFPTDGGDLLMSRSGSFGTRLTLLRPAGEDELFSVRAGALRVLPGIGGLTALIMELGEEGTVVWRLSRPDEAPERVARLPYMVGGGMWLDEGGDRLALAPATPGAAPVVLDLRRGVTSPLSLPDGEHLLLAAPRGGTLLTAALLGESYRLGLRSVDGREPATALDRLNAVEGTVAPLALDPTGRRLALSVTSGTRSRLLIHDLVTDTGHEVVVPAGVLHPSGHWSDSGLRLVHSGSDRPTRVISLPDPAEPRPHDPHDGGPRWTAATTRHYAGPAGAIEAVVYGDPVRDRHLVVALHGGPEAAWQLGFEPLFQRLAAAGFAVVAPNQRGSTGYGAAHRDAVHGAWGGPDLDDILHLGRFLAAERGPGRSRPMLHGASYGAYLALLATAAEPGLWERATVVAPFLSGGLLYEDGPAPVRNLIDRIGGRADIHDELGPRDLLRLAPRIRTPLLIVHGEQDPIIPVSHSRRLYERLSRLPGTGPVTYLEVQGSGHDPLSDADGEAVSRRVLDFLDGHGQPEDDHA